MIGEAIIDQQLVAAAGNHVFATFLVVKGKAAIAVGIAILYFYPNTVVPMILWLTLLYWFLITIDAS